MWVSLVPCPFGWWISLVPDPFLGVGISRGRELVCLGWVCLEGCVCPGRWARRWVCLWGGEGIGYPGGYHRIQSAGRWYASYWNAFWFSLFLFKSKTSTSGKLIWVMDSEIFPKNHLCETFTTSYFCDYYEGSSYEVRKQDVP